MKTQVSLASDFYDNEMVEEVLKEDTKAKEKYSKKAIHGAKNNFPKPVGDSVVPVINEITSTYETIIARVILRTQPESHTPEAKMEIEHAAEKDRNLDKEIKHLERQNQHNELEMPHTSNEHGHVTIRVWVVLLLTLIIFIGDSSFNIKAFELIGDNLILTLILSLSVSISIFLATHILPIMYKQAETVLKRRLILYGSFAGATIVFISLAVFRTTYLALQNVYIKPIHFVIMNLFLFTVSYLISLCFFPTLDELREHWTVHNRIKGNKKRDKKIAKLKKERAVLRDSIFKKSKHHLNAPGFTMNLIGLIKSCHRGTINLYFNTNIDYRTDNEIPDCFYRADSYPEIDTNKFFN